MNFLNSVSSSMLAKTLDGLWARQQAISNNIAHYETPGYKAKYVSFEDELRSAITNAKSMTKSEKIDTIRGIKPQFGAVEDLSLRADENNVDIEQQNIELARVQLQFGQILRANDENTSRLRAAITGTTR